MTAYNKLVGSVIGGIVGIIAMHFGLGEAFGASMQPLVDLLTPVLGAWLGTFLAPANA